jgi:carbamoyltransferase
MPSILGLNAYHGDSAACLFVEGKLIAAAEEERFRRIKHWAGLPTQAIDCCLREVGLTINGLDHIAVNRNSSRANATRAMNASPRRSLVGFELAAPSYQSGFLSGVDKAAARTKALRGRHP